ncbi:MAG: ABC transporter ATP-binding protein [Chloroflexota bacterium]|nr:MAG: ABC transporter ATP-binding protein [Chloroflexota bacterium]
MLRVENLTCKYGSATALTDITLDVAAGESICLLGSNGAGKTTLVKAICGLLRPTSGRILFEGHEIQGKSPSHVIASGIAVVPEGRQVFTQLSVADNLVVGACVRGNDRKGTARHMDEVYELFPILKEKSQELAGMLSGGQQQMLAIGMGLMAEPRMLILDEPSLGLAPSIIPLIFDTIRNLNQKGITTLIMDQHVRETLEIAHRGYVMQTGHMVRQGTASELWNDPVVQDAYLGLAATA